MYSDSDEKIEIYWDEKFFQYGIGVKINEPSVFTDFIIWNVSNNSIWSKTINKTIENIKVNWEVARTTEEKNGKTESFIYPQGISLTFSNGKKIFISASGFLNETDNEVFGMLDNLTVTDTEKLARQAKMTN